MIKKATFGDYFDLQGGVPSIEQDEEGLWHIRHNYLKGSIEVTTHISPSEIGTVIINNTEYDVAKLLKFDGKSCEQQSRMVGGEGYNRTK